MKCLLEKTMTKLTLAIQLCVKFQTDISVVDRSGLYQRSQMIVNFYLSKKNVFFAYIKKFQYFYWTNSFFLLVLDKELLLHRGPVKRTQVMKIMCTL